MMYNYWVWAIEILVIEGASGILDFLLYSHCTQWPDQKFYLGGSLFGNQCFKTLLFESEAYNFQAKKISSYYKNETWQIEKKIKSFSLITSCLLSNSLLLKSTLYN